ncbi:RnfH family protein [Kingella negevensis]|uniref:RnfH family protein n=1 Tax=Kingella negevensis TaxID=1522312 RepID=UPI002543E9B6|nr:RnfH family protein [Kingella negevensis]WII92618.1 RnfH family protein [Kingella negevensis]
MDNINIEVAYGTAQQQKLYTLQLPTGSTARQAAIAANVQTDFPESQPENAPLGIFGKAIKDNHILREGDRVEIYRPLLADPKDARRKRVAQKKNAA